MIKIKRRKTKVIKIGGLLIGGNNPVLIQSMVKTRTGNTLEAIKQIRELEACGCSIARLAVRDSFEAKALKKIKANVRIPIVADIHFNYRLAIEAIESGVDKIRLNPGNIYDKNQVGSIVKEAKLAHIPIRVGLNSGSVQGYKFQGKKPVVPGSALSARMASSALDYVRMLESFNFYDIVISLKASDIFNTIEAYRHMARFCDYPFHLGVTATGAPYRGAIKSTVALSALLLEGIGDTIRVSLTDKPTEEVRVAKAILEAIGLRRFGPEIISCPTCGRCEVDLVRVVRDLESRLSASAKRSGASPKGISYQPSARPIKLAVMGCVVNGPGEAKEADIGVAFGSKDGLLFKKGKSISKISYNRCADILLREVNKYYHR